jgi:hypothetical protein
LLNAERALIPVRVAAVEFLEPVTLLLRDPMICEGGQHQEVDNRLMLAGVAVVRRGLNQPVNLLCQHMLLPYKVVDSGAGVDAARGAPG